MLPINFHRKNSTTKISVAFFRHLKYFFTCILLLGCSENNNQTIETVSHNVEIEEDIIVEKPSMEQVSFELKSNKSRWASQNISTYEIEMQKICFCLPDALRPMIFQIKNDRITSVHYVDSNKTVDPGFYDNYNSLTGLFELAEYALDQNPEEISITYDYEYGYIKKISIDYKLAIADDEITIIASSMRPK